MKDQKADHYGLGDTLMLERIDKLFACGVGELINLPQIVVVGDQSSGKSSVLEGLIRKPLPRDSGLCTRFATQIIFRRAAEEGVSVAIIADRNASVDHRTRVESWTKDNLTSLDADTFSEIMTEVHQVMGLAQSEDGGGQTPTFSNDVLRLEITGPDQEHLSVIDVPGIFKNTTLGHTSKADIALVRNMVLGYMGNPRSVMLAVIPANVDVATQEILELAKDVDPEGDRTLGVLTKPDLVDKGTEWRIIDLIEGRARIMQLGWHVVRNPGQQDLSDASLDRSRLELAFFRSASPWNSISEDKVGIESLRERLKEVLSSLVRREFPKVQHEITKRLDMALKGLEAMGPERNSRAAQMSFLTELGTKFQRLVTLALDAKYGQDEIFDAQPALRIAPAVLARMEVFAAEMMQGGHMYSFLPQERQGTVQQVEQADFFYEDDTPPDHGQDTFDSRKEDDVDDLAEILRPKQSLSSCNEEGIQTWLQGIYASSRGFELGTFDGSVLATTMKKQSSKWIEISLGFVSDVIVMVHRFITAALHSICSDRHVRDALFATLLDGLLDRYRLAIRHVHFLLTVERDGIPMTVNHYFNENLQKRRQARLASAMEGLSISDCKHGRVVKLKDALQSYPMSNTNHTIQDIHDILAAYYKVARKRFADNTCQQATDHFLLNGADTPLRFFSPVFVGRLSTEELERIAGEAPRVRRERMELSKKIASLTAAREIVLKG